MYRLYIVTIGWCAMALYRLRYFFDAGSGICLWSANDAAREKYGYPVAATDLPLSENTWRRLRYLIAWYDTCFDWNYPPDPSPWTEDERIRFCAEAQTMLQRLRQELGADYEIVDESYTSA